MTDFRALCAELVEALDESNGFLDSDGEWVIPEPCFSLVQRARAALAQPELPSLKEQALEELRQFPIDPEGGITYSALDKIRRALEALPND
jgi:hypothetical protein